MPEIRPFEVRDAAAVAQLTAATPQVAQWSEQSYAQLFDLGYLCWVAVVPPDARVGGFLVTRTLGPEAEILNLVVAPEQRRTGIAAALLEAAERSFLTAHANRAYLEVRASNAQAIAFYKKHRFIPTGSRRNYYQYPKEAALLMEKILTAS
ncbi:MAG: ribosomal protein S18-alanine N-acetyltransferase [Candidatus Acidiferrum sp.]|jgi:ribosomal-protein-alanine N-acetyltransferase